MAVLGVGFHPFATNAAEALVDAARRVDVEVRRIDLPSMRAHVDPAAALTVVDQAGPVAVTHLAPALLYWQPAAASGYLALEQRGVRALNTVAAAEVADDKARTAVLLGAAGVAQVETWACALDLDACRDVAAVLGFPLVVKRTHGAQGRWVRLVPDSSALAHAIEELAAEGRGALVLQPFVAESRGRSLRVICIHGQAVAATERTATSDALRSNVTQGGAQQATVLSTAETFLAGGAARVLGLGLAGVDLLRTRAGPKVLEVNAYPDFTSMLGHVEVDIAALVVEACLGR